MEDRFLDPHEPTTAAILSGEPSPPEIPLFDDAPVAPSANDTDGESDREFELPPSGDETDGEFEFPFVSRDSPAGTAAAADELFADGRIRPFYPVFGRAPDAAPTPALPTRGPLGRLFLEESRSSSTSSTSMSSSAATDAGDLEGVSPESYCIWKPGSSPSISSPTSRPPRKSSSTGSLARWRRISDLVIGRSHSDGKEKFLFLPASLKEEKVQKEKTKSRGVNQVAIEVDTVTAGRRIAHGVKAGGVGGGGATRRTFLPYREELVGFFANVNGLSRSHPHPF